MIVTIDGPAGSGKSTTAKEAAKRLGFRHLDSGSFYRGLTRAALDAGLAPGQWEALTAHDLDALDVHARPTATGYRILAGDDDLTPRLRSAEVNAHVSRIARLPAVRQWLFIRLRGAARDGDLVADGRDMGTVVFPDADVKVYLTADLPTRARRRLVQEGKRDPAPDEVDAEARRIGERDRLDTERAHAPLRRAPDAVEIDTTRLDFEEQVDRIVALVRAQRERSGATLSGG